MIGYIPHTEFKISVFSWSEKFIVKIEVGYYEQIYKFPTSAVENWQDLEKIFDTHFILSIRERFVQMASDSVAAHSRWKQTSENEKAP